MIGYLKAGGIQKHMGLPDRWCEPDSLLRSLGYGGTQACLIPGLPSSMSRPQDPGRSGFLWEEWLVHHPAPGT